MRALTRLAAAIAVALVAGCSDGSQYNPNPEAGDAMLRLSSGLLGAPTLGIGMSRGLANMEGLSQPVQPYYRP
jgi:hypothetical protein